MNWHALKVVNFISNIYFNYKLSPDYEKPNIRELFVMEYRVIYKIKMGTSYNAGHYSLEERFG